MKKVIELIQESYEGKLFSHEQQSDRHYKFVDISFDEEYKGRHLICRVYVNLKDIKHNIKEKVDITYFLGMNEISPIESTKSKKE